MGNLYIKEMTELLTLEEQNKMLEDLFLMEALVIANQEYLKSIGKFEESKKFICKFMNDLSNDDMRKAMKNGVQGGGQSKNKFNA